jgi:hypothetical protein
MPKREELNIHPAKIKSVCEADFWSLMFITTLFTIAKKLK